MENIFSGLLGSGLIQLSFAGSLIAMIAFWSVLFLRSNSNVKFKSDLYFESSEENWFRIGKYAFITSSVAVIFALVNLFGMILTQQYEYHYVFSHSSNELPLNYAIACLWEGQEGSFLLWMVWHSILGLIFLKVGKEWRPGVLGTVASVQGILSSMLLGAYFGNGFVNIFYVILCLIPVGYLVKKSFFNVNKDESFSNIISKLFPDASNTLAIAGVLLTLMAIVNIFNSQTGFLSTDLDQIPFALEAIFGVSFVALTIYWYTKKQITFTFFSACIVLFSLILIAQLTPFSDWKVGSSPFLFLKQVRGNDPIYQMDPDFIPRNGNGLNALLQNYWMVIHPPTLFLGFASTVIPFGFVVSALLERKYKEWINPAAAWTIFSIAILGAGIIMGGYWAYETLNFGGYWNWDPVENASLVPWLTGVAALHGMLSFRKGKTALHMTYILVITTFLLVLYSTFLTRSGILGESSVHSFTDLGMSGQLLVLLLTYVFGIVLLLVHHWKHIPGDEKESTLWSREFFLTLGALTLAFSAIEISLFTSLPVINKIIGTNYAPPANIPYFYYKWNVWFGIAITLLSAIGQFFYWTKIEKKALLKAIFPPFLTAVTVSIGVIGLMIFNDYQLQSIRWKFVYHDSIVKNITEAESKGALSYIWAALTNGILLTADDFLIICAVFAVVANITIIYRLTKNSWNNFKHLGGALAHIGFALMMFGAIFSSGYQDTVSVNLSPNELSKEFSEEEKKTNVQLWRNTPKLVKGYRVEYLGQKQAKAPLRSFQIISDDGEIAKIAFKDAMGDRYALEFPAKFFTKNSITHKTANNTNNKKREYDFDKVRFFIEKQIELIEPPMVNSRTIYQIKFTTLDSSKSFIVYPETELSEGMGFTPHPSRKISLKEDIYVHVTSFPSKEEGPKWSLVVPDKKVVPNQDTFSVGRTLVKVKGVSQIKEGQKFTNTDLAAKVKLEVTNNGKVYLTEPALLIDKNGPVMVDSYIKELGLRFAFVMALPEKEKLVLRVLEKKDKPDYITINAIAKPYINFLWLGTFVMTFGFGIAMYRRVRENKSKN